MDEWESLRPFVRSAFETVDLVSSFVRSSFVRSSFVRSFVRRSFVRCSSFVVRRCLFVVVVCGCGVAVLRCCGVVALRRCGVLWCCDCLDWMGFLVERGADGMQMGWDGAS